MNELLQRVKEAGEDFEWYPTTRAMLEVVAADIKSELADQHDGSCRYSLLDIGAGNGSAIRILCELTSNSGQRYAIEKSRILVDALPADVFVIGTDFHQQTLIDKQVDVIFCNPPYSEFSEWMRRIVSEANCKLIYLVVPQRWPDNGEIKAMINRRCNFEDVEDTAWDASIKRAYRRERGVCQVLSSTTFEHSEFRQARAQVDILKIKLKAGGRRDGGPDVDPFELWFDETFKIDADTASGNVRLSTSQVDSQRLHKLVVGEDDAEGSDKQAGKARFLVAGQNLIERLEELYRADFDRLLGIYRALEKLDRELFKELGVDLPKVREGLKAKIKGLKNLYWNELFSNLDAITDRLTSKSRKSLLDKLTAHTSVDFTADNTYAVVVWAIKNANQYFDTQLCEVYLELAEQENVRNYKSNTRLVTDSWRYSRKEQSHYTLDYRLVINKWSCFYDGAIHHYISDYSNGLSNAVHDLLGDLCTVAENLGFQIETESRHLVWEPGKLNEFRMVGGRLFMDVRAFKKGTIHIRLDQGFMRKLNIEAARLNGWVKSPAEAARETGIAEAADLYGTNFRLKSVPLLGGPDEHS